MSVGIGVIGREVTYTLGGVAVQGRMTKSLELTNTRGETGDESSSGYTQALAKALEKAGSVSIEGLVKNYELFASYFTSDSLSSGMPYNELSTFSMSLSSTGSPTWVSGT